MAEWTLVLPNNTTLGLTENNDLAVVGISGAGMPPINNIYTSYGLADGALYQRSAVQPRLVTILVDAAGTSWVGLHNLRAKLIEAVNPHEATPITLKYSAGGSKPDLYLDCYYDAGLEGGVTEGFVEKGMALRLLATDPYWEGAAGTAHTLGVRQSVDDVSGIVWREADGTINNMDTGISDGSYVYGIARSTSGTTAGALVFGNFTAVGSTPEISVAGAASWNAAIWAKLVTPWTSISDHSTGGAFAFHPAEGPGCIYIGGTYVGTGPAIKYGVWKYDGTTWTWISTGVEQPFALAVSPSGGLWAATYATAGGAHYHIKSYASSTWASVATPALSGGVWALEFAPNGIMYAGGAFTSVDATTASRIAQYNPSTDVWSAVGDGLNTTVLSIVAGADNKVYAGGGFTASGTKAMSRVAQWNGVAWEKMGDGLDANVNILSYQGDDLVAAGEFDASGSRPLPSRVAYWRDNLWLDSGLGYASTNPSVYVVSLDNDLYVGGEMAGTWVGAGATMLTNPGTARAYPKFTLTGPGTLYHIVNYTTDQWVHFNLTLNAGETLTIDLTPGVKTVTSDFRGNMISSIVSGNLIDFYLAPGVNYVGAWIDNASAAGTYQFTARYWSSDGKST